jgi:hypothetical protein
MSNEITTPMYYVDLKDGYNIGDIYIHNDDESVKYEIIDIEAFNQLMLVQEIEDDVA